MNYYYQQWSDRILHCYASEMQIEEISGYLSNGSQRSLLSYEAPEHPIYMMGSIEQLADNRYLATLTPRRRGSQNA